MNTLIRLATENDCSQLCLLSEQYNKVILRNRPQVDKSNLLGNDPNFFLQIFKNKGEVIFVAERGNKIIGFIYAAIETHSDDLASAPYIEIALLIVDESYRHSGIGGSLIKRIHDWAIKKGIKVIHLAVHEFNNYAIAFYQKMGYKTVMRKMERVLE